MARPIRPGAKSPAIAVLLSAVWPGLGQWYAGRDRPALIYGVPVLVVVLLLGSQALGGLQSFAFELISPSFALTVLILIVLVAVWRLLSMADALATTAGRGSWRQGRALPVFVVAGLVIVIVHGVAGYYAYSFYDAGRQIFGDESGDGGLPAASASPGDSTDSTDVGLEATPFATPATASSRINILILGVDNGAANAGLFVRTTSLTDTMMVVSIDPVAKTVAMLSLPRDTSDFPMYNGGTFAGKVNSLMSYANGHPKQFPDGGIVTDEREVGFLLGIPIQYYAEINLAGFQEMVAAVGGVNVVNPKPIDDPTYDWFNGKYGFYLAAGPVHLDPANALAYVRSRKGVGDSDFTRAARQQQVLIALRDKITNPSMFGSIPALLRASAKAIRTNFPSAQISTMFNMAQGISDKSIVKYVLGPPYATNPPASQTGGVYELVLVMAKIKALSVRLFGSDSAYYVPPTPSPSPTSGP